MVLELAKLNILTGRTVEFETAFEKAQNIISKVKGYISHELQKCIENDHQYVLLVKWETLEDHTKGFRGSPEHKEWSELLNHFYESFPVVEHYKVDTNNH